MGSHLKTQENEKIRIYNSYVGCRVGGITVLRAAQCLAETLPQGLQGQYTGGRAGRDFR